MATTDQDWQDIAAAKRASLLSSIPPEWLIPAELVPAKNVLDVTSFPKSSGFFTAEELRIVAAGVVDIFENTSRGKWTAEAVARAFCKAAAVAHQLVSLDLETTNCLTETLFPEALAAAKSLDKHFASTGKPVGPLHGVPISLKDNFNIAGKSSSVGLVAWANNPLVSNSSLADLLIDLGAVLYVKTNVPTAMMIAESVNNLFGRTVNPLNRDLTSGGSSGGESALITLHSSPLGVGSDIGGSVRIPAACCGIFGLRPSSGRFPHFDTTSGMAGQEAIPSVNGPLARTLTDITLYAKAVIDSKPWLVDPKCLPIPWRTVEVPKRLKIAVLWHDGMVTPTPPVSRALKTTVEKLREAGHDIVDWGPEGYSQALTILGRSFVADGGKSIQQILDASGEPWRPELMMYTTAPELGVYQMWQLHRERTAFAKIYLDRWNACEGLDAILGPTTPYATVKHGDFQHVGYTGIWNVLDYTAISFPTGIVVDKEVDLLPPNQQPLSELDKDVQKRYDAASVHGMPVSLQLTGRKLEEEKVLAMTQRVLEALEADKSRAISQP